MKEIEPTTISPRQTDILGHARSKGRVDVDDLATHFAVTPQTIRKDINELSDRGLLQRVHGGAVYPSNVTNFAYDSRRVLAADAKQRIGTAAAARIPDNSSIMLNIGTTTEQVAFALRQHVGLMAITNNLNVANILREAPSAEVIIAGGLVRHADGGIVGEATIDLINQFRVDFAVIGSSAIDADGSLLDFDYREVRVAQAIIRHARCTILVADSMKFRRTAPVRIGHLSEIDVFVTDQKPAQEIVDICQANNVELMIAETARVNGG